VQSPAVLVVKEHSAFPKLTDVEKELQFDEKVRH